MFLIFAISFREFLEACLIAGVFLGMSKKLQLGKEKAILIYTLIAFTWSLALGTYVFSFSSQLAPLFTGERGEMWEAVINVVSSLFVAYAIFSIHGVIAKFTGKGIKTIKKKISASDKYRAFIPWTVFLFVFKEGCESIVFNFSPALTTHYDSVIYQFFAGFVLALIIGILVQKALIKLSIKRVFRITEMFIILTGANALTSGLEEIFHQLWNFDLSGPYSLFISLFYIILIYAVFIKEETISVD